MIVLYVTMNINITIVVFLSSQSKFRTNCVVSSTLQSGLCLVATYRQEGKAVGVFLAIDCSGICKKAARIWALSVMFRGFSA